MAEFTPGSLLKLGSQVCLTRDDQQLTASVFRSRGDRCELALTVDAARKAQDDGWVPGVTCPAEATGSGAVLNVDLTIDSLTFRVDGAIISATLHTSADREQQRETLRVHVLLDAKVHSGPELSLTHESLIGDLSLSGARVKAASMTESPELAEKVRVRFESTHFDGMEIDGQVRWVKELTTGWEFGVVFLDVDRKATTSLQKYVWEFQLKELQNGSDLT